MSTAISAVAASDVDLILQALNLNFCAINFYQLKFIFLILDKNVLRGIKSHSKREKNDKEWKASTEM